jgi:hypothetical protein
MTLLSPKSVLRAVSGAATTIVVLAAPVSAQTPTAPPAAPAPSGLSCEIDNGSPQGIARATFSLARAAEAAKTGNASKDLRDGIALASNPATQKANPVGSAYVLGQAYVLMLQQPGVTGFETRSAVGLTTNPTATIDLYAAADSAWQTVEKTSPGCAAVAAQWRQQKPWLDVTNQAINALNADKLDSAEIYAKRSLLLSKAAPYGYSVLASIARNKKNFAAANQYWKQTLEVAGKDSSYNDVRERTLYDLAAATTVRAQAATGAEKKTLAREAITAWNAVLAGSRDDQSGTTAIQNLHKMYIAAGDSMMIPRLYAALIAEPAKYGENTLMQAGIVASQFKRSDDASLLFAAVAARNPYSRDALNNLAASYIFVNEYTRVFPVADKLTSLDPSNPDNWMLYAFAYGGLLKATKQAALTKKYTDSLTFYNAKAEKLAVRVAFTEFSRSPDATTLKGTIENRGAAAKSYVLVVDFLDRAGNVLFTETANVGPVAPKATRDFTIRTNKGGVSGFRYKPVT